MKKYITEKRRRFVLFVFSCIGLFMLFDSYCVSIKLKPEIVLERMSSRTTGLTKSYNSYKIITSSKERTVTRDVFENCLVGDTVFVGVSTISNTVQKISTSFYGINNTYNIGFINSGVGPIFLFIALIFLLVYILMSVGKVNFDKTSTTIGFALLILFVLYHYITF